MTPSNVMSTRRHFTWNAVKRVPRAVGVFPVGAETEQLDSARTARDGTAVSRVEPLRPHCEQIETLVIGDRYPLATRGMFIIDIHM